TATPNEAALFATSGGTPAINQYDLVVLACEGYEENVEANWANLGAYTAAGGRVFTTDLAHGWLAHTNTCTSKAQCAAGDTCTQGLCIGANNVTENPAYAGVATWDTFQNTNGSP